MSTASTIVPLFPNQFILPRRLCFFLVIITECMSNMFVSPHTQVIGEHGRSKDLFLCSLSPLMMYPLPLQRYKMILLYRVW